MDTDHYRGMKLGSPGEEQSTLLSLSRPTGQQRPGLTHCKAHPVYGMYVLFDWQDKNDKERLIQTAAAERTHI